MSTKQPYTYTVGTIPLVVSMPHTSAHVPEALLARFTDAAKKLPDTDWHVQRLYSFVHALGVHVLVPGYSRYVVDLNRGEESASLYPGKFTTTRCSMQMFDGNPIYRQGQEPDAAEIEERVSIYWQPYHDKLRSVLGELKAKHKRVILFDAHSIRSEVPILFEGVLPDLNIGTADGKSADKTLSERLVAAAGSTSYSVAYNGRFKGGYITRHYGKPAEGIDAIQLELAQKNYMNEDYPFAYDEAKAQKLQSVLKPLLSELIKTL